MTKTRHLPVVSLVITLFFCTVFILLGFWQLRRASDQALHNHILAHETSSGYLSIARLAKMHKPFGFPVKVSGRFDNAHSFLLDNRFLKHRVGYDVITPLQTQAGLWVLVNRGWLPRGPSRAVLPAIPSISGQVTLTARSHKPESNIFLPAPKKDQAGHWPARIADVDIPHLTKMLHQPLLPFVLRLDKHQPHTENEALPHNWSQPVRMTPARHRAYAIQWFLFACIALGIFLTTRWRKRHSNMTDNK